MINLDLKTPQAAIKNGLNHDQNRYSKHLRNRAAYDKNRKVLEDWQNAQSLE